MSRFRLKEMLWVASVLVAAGAPVRAQVLNRNLVVNGGAEDGPSATEAIAAQVADVPGWTRTGDFSVGRYGSGDFLNAQDYGCANRGRQFFYGGPGVKASLQERSTATQTIDLSAAAFDIDTNRVKFTLSGYIGSLGSAYEGIETTSLKAVFLDGAGGKLLETAVPKLTVGDIDVPSGLFLRTTNGFLLPGTRKVQITLDLSATERGFNSLSADDISLVLTTATPLGTNLIVNGDAEAAEGALVPGWNAHTCFSAEKYGADTGFLSTDPGPSNRGTLVFRCQWNKTPATAYQTIDVSSIQSMVDRGVVGYDAEAWMGGTAAPDTATLSLTFFDAEGAQISSAVLGVSKLSDRGGKTGMVYYSGGGSNLPAGTRSIRLMLTFDRLRTDPENMTVFVDNVSLRLTPPLNIATVVNAASSQAGPFAPGEYVSIYGTGLGPDPGSAATGMQKAIGKVKVRFNGVDAFLTYAGAGQINALVPYGIGGKVDAEVEYDGNRSNWFTADTGDAAPGIFTQQYGGGPAWVVNQDSAWNSADNPAARGSYIAFWTTGQGLVTPAGKDGETIAAPNFPSPLQPVKIVIGGVEVDPAFAGLVYTGVMQVNVRIPDNAPTGTVPLKLKVGGTVSRDGVSIAVK